KHLNRLVEPFDRHWSKWGDLNKALSQLQRPGGESDATGRCELLHPGRQMGGLAYGRIVHAEIAADGADHNLPRVDPDADLHLHALLPAKLMRVAPHHLLHPEGGIAGPNRVVLVAERRAEERHDAVAHHLIHRALEAVYGVHHPPEHGIEDLTRLLGV